MSKSADFVGGFLHFMELLAALLPSVVHLYADDGKITSSASE